MKFMTCIFYSCVKEYFNLKILFEFDEPQNLKNQKKLKNFICILVSWFEEHFIWIFCSNLMSLKTWRFFSYLRNFLTWKLSSNFDVLHDTFFLLMHQWAFWFEKFPWIWWALKLEYFDQNWETLWLEDLAWT